jgi:hypothetical protein
MHLCLELLLNHDWSPSVRALSHFTSTSWRQGNTWWILVAICLAYSQTRWLCSHNVHVSLSDFPRRESVFTLYTLTIHHAEAYYQHGAFTVLRSFVYKYFA